MNIVRFVVFQLALVVLWLPVQAPATTILFLGDSLTSGYGVERSEAYPSLISNMLQQDYPETITIINGGISGSTSAGALSRLRWYAQVQPDILFLALGANDGLRGLALDQLNRNLEQVIQQAKQQSMVVILAGMMVPPNYGKEYSTGFRQVYVQLAEKYDLLFVPFLLDGVAGREAFNLADGIHPNPQGHRQIALLAYPYIVHALQRLTPSPEQTSLLSTGK